MLQANKVLQRESPKLTHKITPINTTQSEIEALHNKYIIFNKNRKHNNNKKPKTQKKNVNTNNKNTQNNRSINVRTQYYNIDFINTDNCSINTGNKNLTVTQLTQLTQNEVPTSSGGTTYFIEDVSNYKTFLVKQVSREYKSTGLDLTNSILSEARIYLLMRHLVHYYITPFVIIGYDVINCQKNNTIFLINETAKNTTKYYKLSEFLTTYYAKLNDMIILHILFQIVYTLDCFNKINLEHRDLHINNVLVFLRKDNNILDTPNFSITNYYEFKYFKSESESESKFKLYDLGIDIRIFDFDQSFKFESNVMLETEFNIKSFPYSDTEIETLNPFIMQTTPTSDLITIIYQIFIFFFDILTNIQLTEENANKANKVKKENKANNANKVKKENKVNKANRENRDNIIKCLFVLHTYFCITFNSNSDILDNTFTLENYMEFYDKFNISYNVKNMIITNKSNNVPDTSGIPKNILATLEIILLWQKKKQNTGEVEELIYSIAHKRLHPPYNYMFRLPSNYLKDIIKLLTQHYIDKILESSKYTKIDSYNSTQLDN